MIRTKLTEMLGIEYPIVQGCMQWISRAPLVAAVSEAGGLGLLSSSTFSSADELQAEIRKIKSMTSKPFAVNLTLMPSLVVPDYAGYIRVCAEEGVKVMETAGRPPKDDMVRAIKDAGMVLIHKCTTVKHALKAQSLGADMVVADGFEFAGHPGENDLGTMVLTPRCVEALDIPVICAGGVSTGRQMQPRSCSARRRVHGHPLPAVRGVPRAPGREKLPRRARQRDGDDPASALVPELHAHV